MMYLLLVFFVGYYLELTTCHPVKKPHIIFFLGDDIGYNDVGWNNPKIETPFMNDLASKGVILDSYYTFAVCSPSRASLLSGHYSHRLGMQRWVLGATQPYGVPLRFDLLPKKMTEAGYNAHAVGKWHVGYCDWNYTPTYRGFQSWIGFYNGGEENYEHCVSYFKNRTSTGQCNGFDFRDGTRAAHEYDGIHSGEIYTKRTLEIINNYQPNDSPLMLYVALTDTHFPLEVPKRFEDRCPDSVNEARRNFCRTMAVLDEEIKNITLALKEKDMYKDSVIIFASDNGGATTYGGNNYPLRGEKGGIYEGGTRVPAFVHSPLLQKTGYINKHLIHVADWYPTILALAGVTEEIGVDGINQWAMISRDEPSSRRSLPYLLDQGNNGFVMGAVRNEKYKFISGSGGMIRNIISEAETVDNSFNVTALGILTNPHRRMFDFADTTVQLYDLQNDPTESKNLADSMPEIVNEMKALLDEYNVNSRPFNPIRSDPKGDPKNFDNTFTPGWCTAYYDAPKSYDIS